MTCDDIRDLAAGFVLDALEPDEMDAVRAHLASCDDAHGEIAELASALPALAASAPVMEPSAGLGARIRAAAAADLAADVPSAPASPSPLVAVPPAVAPAAVTPIPARRRPGLLSSVLGIAAVLAIVVLGGWNVALQNQLSDAQAYEQSVAAVLEVGGQPGALTAVLTAEGGGGASGLAAVSAGGEVTLAMQSMAPTTGTQVYEAWMIAGEDAPVALGGFQVDSSGTASFEGGGLPTDPGIVLALTLEPGPGATAPTGPIVASGAATSAG